MTITSRTVNMSDKQLMTNVTSEMVADLKNIDFYVKKDLVKPINNKIITIKECSYSNHYIVHINYIFFERLMKLTKIRNIDTYKEIENIVEICEKNKRGWFGVAEDDAVEEMSQQINKDILKRLFELGTQNAKYNI